MFRQLRVIDKVRESQTITSFYLQPDNDQPLASYLPGQYITLRLLLPGKIEPVLRSYTLSSAPHQPFYRITVKREGAVAQPGLVSGFLHDSVQVDDTLWVSAPQGDFFLPTASRRPIVLLSGGVGITPMLSMLAAIASEPNPRQVWFLHGSVNEDVQPMRRYLQNLADIHAHIEAHIHHSQPADWETLGKEYDVLGQLDVAFLQHYLPSHEADFYLCGPAGFMETLYNGLRSWGVADEAIFYEYFGTGKSLRPAVLRQPTDSIADAFTIMLKQSGRSLPWNSSHKNLLSLLEANAISVPSSCRQGTCTTCSTGLVSGRISYEPEPLAEPFDGDILVCCARPESDLVLDL